MGNWLSRLLWPAASPRMAAATVAFDVVAAGVCLVLARTIHDRVFIVLAAIQLVGAGLWTVRWRQGRNPDPADKPPASGK